MEIRRVDAQIDENNNLKIRVQAVVDGVAVEREYTFFRRKDNAVKGAVSTWAEAPGGREADLTRLRALSTVIFGEAGNLMAGGKQLGYTRRHLEHAMRFREVKEAAERWLRGG